jgi:hypothetical protein
MAEFDPDAFLAKDKEKKRGFDPDAFLKKTKPETALQTFGRSTASMADSALNALTGTLDYGAYNLARAAGLSPERAQAETTSPKDVVGRAFGVTGTAGYEQAPLRQLGTYAGEVIGENVVQPLAQTTGLPEQDVASMVNTGMMAAAPAVPKVAKPVYNAARATPQAVADVAGGFTGALTGKIAKPGAVPEPWQTQSVRQPVSSTYYTPEQLAAWRANEISTQQLTPQPISNLGPKAMSALGKTEGNVPYAGQGFRAFGEQLGETYRNPVNLLTDVGLDLLTGGGLPTATRLGYKTVKGVQGAGAAKTLEKAGFSPLYPEELAALKSGQPHPSAIGPAGTGPVVRGPVSGPVAPQNYPLVPTGPLTQLPPTVMPMGTAPRAVNIEGQRSVLPYQINTENSQAARSVQSTPAGQTVRPVAQPQPQPPTQVAQQQAAAKLSPAKTPEQQAALQATLDQIRARGAARQPVQQPVQPVKPEPLPVEQPAPKQAYPFEFNEPLIDFEPRNTVADELAARAAAAFGDKYRAPAAQTVSGPVAPTPLENLRARAAASTDPATQALIDKAEQTRQNRSAGQQARRALSEKVKDYVVIDKKNNKLSINQGILNDLMVETGVKIDMSQAPDITNMKLAVGRRAMRDFVEQQLRNK